jgi:hypothetical protein
MLVVEDWNMPKSGFGLFILALLRDLAIRRCGFAKVKQPKALL